MQTFHLFEGQIGAGRIVGIGEKDDLGARVTRVENLVDVGGEPVFRRHDRRAAGGPNGDRKDEECMRGDDPFIAWAYKRPRKQVQEIVGPVAADDPRRIETIAMGDRLAQRRVRAVGIEFEFASCRSKSLDRSR